MTDTTFCVYADSLDPEQVSARVGLTPTTSYRKGDPIVTARCRYGNHPGGGWLLSSRDHVQAEDLTAHLDWLLAKLEPAAQRIRKLRDDGHDIAIIITLSADSLGGGPTLSPELLARLASLGSRSTSISTGERVRHVRAESRGCCPRPLSWARTAARIRAGRYARRHAALASSVAGVVCGASQSVHLCCGSRHHRLFARTPARG